MQGENPFPPAPSNPLWVLPCEGLMAAQSLCDQEGKAKRVIDVALIPATISHCHRPREPLPGSLLREASVLPGKPPSAEYSLPSIPKHAQRCALSENTSQPNPTASLVSPPSPIWRKAVSEIYPCLSPLSHSWFEEDYCFAGQSSVQ